MLLAFLLSAAQAGTLAAPQSAGSARPQGGGTTLTVAPDGGNDNARRPSSPAEERYWLENMVTCHRFTLEEVRAATGMSIEEIRAAVRRYHLEGARPPTRSPTDPLRVLPYPGGRHPRIGFLEGAIRPQRETKVSVFLPWDDTSYVVLDVPEAIFSNLGLTHLAHTHVPTLWTKQNVSLPILEWNRRSDGALDVERVLPNAVAFGAKVVPGQDGLRMGLWLRNGTPAPLRDMRVQNCVMLKGAAGFNQQTNTNKVFAPPFAAVSSPDGHRWIITAWERCGRAWGNAPVPCLHSDPKLPDCAPGQTVRVRGWLSFYEGSDVRAEFERLSKSLSFGNAP